MHFDPLWVLGIGVLGLVFLAFWMMIASCFQKCGPNQAMIVSGLFAQKGEHGFTIVKGGGAVVMPLVQQKSFLSLEVITIDVKSEAPIITRNGVPIFVDGVAQVKVRGDEDSIATAAEQFLNKTDDEIKMIAHETLVGHLRAILGTLEVEELITNFDQFAQKVQEVSIVDLKKMGLTVVSFTIKEIKDNVGYLDSLGRKKTAETKKEADIGVALATRETRIAQANAERDAAIELAKAQEEGAKAKLVANTHVAEAQKEFELKQAQYQQEISSKKAASDLEYKIVEATTSQKLTEETQQIQIVKMQKEVELQTVEVKRREIQLAAEVTKPAEAEQSKVRIYAQAEQEKRKILAQADADATKLRAVGDAEATRVRAIAEAEAIRATGLAQAEAQKAQGLAEAQVIAAKGEAEAQAMMKKAEAYRMYNEAAIASMIIEKLPEVVSAAATPLSKIGNVTVLASSNDSIGASRLSNEVLNVAAQSMTLVKGLTGFDLAKALTHGEGSLPGPSTTLNVTANTNGESRSSDKILEQPKK
ncbi:MAG TPA: SPFH domain-containing protein [Candidatus Obscuribacterales bacterium]